MHYLHTDVSCFLFASHHFSIRPQLTQILSHPNPLSPPSASLPVTQKPGKAHTHTPTRDWRSDKIKNAQQLIWIKGAHSIRIQKEILSLMERQKGRSGFCRNREQWRTTKRCCEQENLHFLYKC